MFKFVLFSLRSLILESLSSNVSRKLLLFFSNCEIFSCFFNISLSLSAKLKFKLEFEFFCSNNILDVFFSFCVIMLRFKLSSVTAIINSSFWLVKSFKKRCSWLISFFKYKFSVFFSFKLFCNSCFSY